MPTVIQSPSVDKQGKAAVIGRIDKHMTVYLYEAADFRTPGLHEVFVFGGRYGTYYYYMSKPPLASMDLRRMPLMTGLVANAYKAERYWPGDDVMAQRDLDTLVSRLEVGR